MTLRPKTLLALLVLVHALAHPLVHAAPLFVSGGDQAQAPASSSQSQARPSGKLPCAACLAHRLIPAVPLLASALHPAWEPVAMPPQLQVFSSFILTRPARAPPPA